MERKASRLLLVTGLAGLAGLVALSGCGTNYAVTTSGSTERDEIFRSARSIALMPVAWSNSSRGPEEAAQERVILSFFGEELRDRGYDVTWLEPHQLDARFGTVRPRSDVQLRSDLTLRVEFSQRATTHAWGYSSSTATTGVTFSQGPGSAPCHDLTIKATLQQGETVAWYGDIVVSSKAPDLSDQAESMVDKLLSRRFKHRAPN